MSQIPWAALLADPDDRSQGLLLCAPVRLMPTSAVPGASSDGTCAECLESVWLTPSSRQELAANTLGCRLHVCCIPCAARHIPDLAEQLGAGSQVSLLPGQSEEIEARGVTTADALQNAGRSVRGICGEGSSSR